MHHLACSCVLMLCVALQEVAALQQELDGAATKAAENQATLKGIEAVLDYRATKKQVEQLQATMDTLKQQVGQVEKVIAGVLEV